LSPRQGGQPPGITMEKSLLQYMDLGEIDEYNVPFYQTQVHSFWSETKSDFRKLLNYKSGPFPDNHYFYERTLAWADLFKAIQDEFKFDDSCYTIRLGGETYGDVASWILNLRTRYGYYFGLPYIETSAGLDQYLKELAGTITDIEYMVEGQLPGLTREQDGKKEDMLVSTNYAELLRELKLAYLDPTTRGFPFLVGFSGGKDSTLVAKAVFEMLENLPKYQRIREVHIACADTGIEVPLVQTHIRKTLKKMQEYARAKKLPVTVHRLRAEVSQRFFSLMIGLGYPPPSRLCRYCTDRLKIRPNFALTAKLAGEHGKVICLLGTREDESVERKKSIKRNSVANLRYNETQQTKKIDHQMRKVSQLVYQPLRYMTTDTVWESLEKDGLPWETEGYRRLRRLYEDSSSPGELTARHGCYVCTLVREDKSLKNLIQVEGNEWMQPLYDFRKTIIEVSQRDDMREPFMYDRDSGRILKDGTRGALNKKARRILFDKLMQLREEIARTKPEDIDFEVVSDQEIEQIKAYWVKIDRINPWKKEKDAELTLFG